MDSHGVSLIPWYVEAVDIDHMKTKLKSRIEKETPATILIDADHAFGAVVTTLAMNKVIEKASKIGIGWAFIRDTNHQGAMGYYPMLAAEQGMAGIGGFAPKGLSKWAKEGYQLFMLGYVIDGNVEKLKARIDEMKSLVDK